MFTVTETVSIARPDEEVFRFLTDSRNRSRWDATVVSEVVTSDAPLGVGSTIHTRMRAVGREVDFDWRVTRFDAPTRMSLVSTAGIMSTSTTFDLTPVGAGCRVSVTIDAEPEGMMRFVEPMISGSVRSTLATSLGRAKELLEKG